MKQVVVISIILFLLIIFSPIKIFADGGNFKVNVEEIPLKNSVIQNSDIKNKPNLISELKVPPNMAGFLSDVLAFQTAILAILIPLSFDVISRISDRYKSEIIINRFQKERVFISLVVILIVNITYMIILKFFDNSTQLFSCLSLFLALISIVLLCLFLMLVINYTRISFIKKKLFTSATNVIK